MRARVGFVDDHPAITLGLSAVLAATDDLVLAGADRTVAGLIGSGRGFDVVLLDLILADGSRPAENVRALGVLGAPVLAFTSGERPELVREASRAGVAGMVRKSERLSTTLEAIRAVLRGEIVATPDWAAALDEDTAFVSAGLTAREAEVLELYAAGETAARVADQLFISRETVLDHLRRIRAKYASVGREAPTKVHLHSRAIEDRIL